MKKSRVIRIVLILVVAGVLYWQRGKGPDQGASGGSDRSSGSGQNATLKELPFGKDGAKNAEKVRGYDKFTGVTLVKNDRNDGDSFFVKMGGKEVELRLYFVDTPEKYLSDRHQSQQRRVAEQASEMGGVSPEQIVEVGKAAKQFMEQQLKGKTFTVYTNWEQVFEGDRYYGFVELPSGSYLSTELIRNGLARIHTKGPGSKENPVPTPDGKSFHQHRDMLFDLERQAQKADRGAWGL